MAIGSGGLPLGCVGGGALEFPSVVFRCSIFDRTGSIYIAAGQWLTAYMGKGEIGARSTGQRAPLRARLVTDLSAHAPALCLLMFRPSHVPACLFAGPRAARSHTCARACACVPMRIVRCTEARIRTHAHARAHVCERAARGPANRQAGMRGDRHMSRQVRHQAGT